MPPGYNRTEGDGTDSPMVASPYHDQNRRDKFSPGYPNGTARHQSPSRVSPRHSWQRPNSINIPKSQDYQQRAPPGADPRWSSPPTAPHNDWQQVREHGYHPGYHDGYDQPPPPPRSYTPPIPQYNPQSEQSPLRDHHQYPQHEYQLHSRNPNYEHHDSIDYPSSSPQRAFDNFNTPYSPPRAEYERRMNEYVIDDSPAVASVRPTRLDLNGGYGGPVAHQPVLSQSYRTPNNAYNLQSYDTNNDRPPQQQHYDPYGYEEDRRFDQGVMYYKCLISTL